MLIVRDLRKQYGDLIALDGVSFEVHPGEVVGFLGPNGAGKSTTMKIVTGFIPPGGGTASVDGFEVTKDPLEVKRRIGYLPEHTPLYADMRVRDYLTYRAQIKGVPRATRRTRVDYVLEKTQLVDRARQIIGTLSKGYKQRVGIADALVGDPKLLILDEPTIGLDPHQIQQVRGLIKELAETHTIILSTHILVEVEMVCDRALIISRGRIVADHRIEELVTQKAQHQRHVLVTVRAPQDAGQVIEDLRELPGVAAAVAHEERGAPAGVASFSLHLAPGAEAAAVCEAVSARAGLKGWTLRELAPERVSLETVFLRLTQPRRDERSPASAGVEDEGEVAA